MISLGVVALSKPQNGGTFQYTNVALECLAGARRHKITIYTTADNHHYDHLGLPVRHIASSRILSVAASLAAGAGLPLADPFADEDVLFAPIFALHLTLTRKPFAFTLHDMQEMKFPQNFSRAQKLWRSYTNRVLAARAGRIVCEAEHVKGDIVTYLGVPPDRVDVIPSPPMPIDPGSRAFGDVRTRHGLPQRFLFYPAQFWTHKNHVRLIEAFAKIAPDFPDVALVLTGTKRGTYEQVVAKAAELGIAPRVRHLGYLSQAELFALYSEATALVLPTLYESISIPVYEAFQLGTPVCASDIAGLREQIADAGVLFDPFSVPALAAAMQAILADSALRNRIVDAGRARIASMTRTKYADRLCRLIDVLAVRR